jgi:hypothetical protein
MLACTSLVIEWLTQTHPISLISQDQRGFAFFVMVNPGFFAHRLHQWSGIAMLTVLTGRKSINLLDYSKALKFLSGNHPFTSFQRVRKTIGQL